MATEEKLAKEVVKEYERYCGLLSEFYDSHELNDFYQDCGELVEFVHESDLVRKCFEQHGLELSETLSQVILMSKVNEKLRHAYEKNLEAIKYGFGNVKIPIKSVTAEEIVEEAKSIAEELSGRG